MEASPPPDPADLGLAFAHSLPSPSHPCTNLPDEGVREDHDEGVREDRVAGDSGKVTEQLVGGRRDDSPRSRKRQDRGGGRGSIRTPPASTAMAAPPPPAPTAGGDEGANEVAGNGGEVMEQMVHAKDSPRSRILEKKNHKRAKAAPVVNDALRMEQPRPVINSNVEVLKDLTRKIRKKSPNVAPRITSPRVTTSPGVNMLMRTATLKRASPLVRHGSSKKSKMAGSPHSPSEESQSSPPQLTPISPTLADLSPGGRTPTPHGKSIYEV